MSPDQLEMQDPGTRDAACLGRSVTAPVGLDYVHGRAVRLSKASRLPRCSEGGGTSLDKRGICDGF